MTESRSALASRHWRSAARAAPLFSPSVGFSSSLLFHLFFFLTIFYCTCKAFRSLADCSALDSGSQLNFVVSASEGKFLGYGLDRNVFFLQIAFPSLVPVVRHVFSL